jgi:hypothetical protein
MECFFFNAVTITPRTAATFTAAASFFAATCSARIQRVPLFPRCLRRVPSVLAQKGIVNHPLITHELGLLTIQLSG